VKHTTFGKDASGKPLTVELGANWVQGLGTTGGPQNPIWTLVYTIFKLRLLSMADVSV
jgi:polyamine oxidase